MQLLLETCYSSGVNWASFFFFFSFREIYCNRFNIKPVHDCMCYIDPITSDRYFISRFVSNLLESQRTTVAHSITTISIINFTSCILVWPFPVVAIAKIIFVKSTSRPVQTSWRLHSGVYLVVSALFC